jgi:hypothetical protein
MEDLPPIVPGLAAMGGPAAEACLERGEPFVVTIDDVNVRVEYTGGTTPTVFLSAPYAPRGGPPTVAAGYRESGIERIAAARPLMIELSLEGEDERRAKRAGVSREVQTGDATFDRGVYVCSSSEDRVVSRVLASPRLRAAVRMLLEDGFGKIEIDDENGNITTQRGISGHARAEAAAVARAFADIARDVPVVDQTGRRRRRTWPIAAGIGLLFGVPAVVVTAFITAPILWVALGCAAGGALGAAVAVPIARTQHGRSDSHWRVRAVYFELVSTGVLLGTIAALWHASAIAWPLAIGVVIAGSILLALAMA